MLPTALLMLVVGQSKSSCQTYLLSNPAPGLFRSGKAFTLELPPVASDVPWTEAIPSWNVDRPEAAELTVEARVVYPDHTTKYYSFGEWSGSQLIGARHSVNGQKDRDGTVLTDTLRMVRPGGKIQFRLTGREVGSGRRAPELSRFFVNLSDAGALAASSDEVSGVRSPAWGMVMQPPELAQGYYPGGKALCSPTSVAMVLGYWSGRTGDKSLAITVPVVQSSVFDSVYGGTGNWAFNTSFAGSRPGMEGFAARLNGIEDLENWVSNGVPVVCSVSWYLLHGEALQSDEEGHLVVLDGFMPNGDPVFNDPGDRSQVRKVYKRSDFLKAWAYSKHAVYVICPPKFVDEAEVQKVGG